MSLESTDNLTEEQVKSSLKLLVKDGLFAEVMATLTGGAFLVALSLKLGASNFQIGMLAAMPILANIFQLATIYVVNKYSTRKGVTVYSSLFGRIPLLVIGFLPFLFPSNVGLNILIALLSIHYIMGAASGCSWTSWTRDIVPEKMLGSYFAQRSRLITILSVILSLVTAFSLDYIKVNYPNLEQGTYSIMFFIGGIFGLYGVRILSKVPEPKLRPVRSNIFQLFRQPFRNVNFRKLLVFNAWWAFAVNLAAPFFSVYMLKMLGLKLMYVIGFTLLSQFTAILFIRVWGRYSDKYSNKSILMICAPIYLFCILGWTFTTMPAQHILTMPLLFLIYIFNGISTAGINLALSNIGLKLAPKKEEAIVYLSAKGMVNALFAGIAPIIGGLFADSFATRELSWNIEWKGPGGNLVFHTLNLQQWDFFFALAFILGGISLYKLGAIEEQGEVKKRVIVNEMAGEFTRAVKRKAVRTHAAIFNVRCLFAPQSSSVLVKSKTREWLSQRKLKLFKVKTLILNYHSLTNNVQEKKAV